MGSLESFLNEETIDISPLFIWWDRCCDVPFEYNKGRKIKTIQAMRCINSFRNRFAHVPFPHDPLDNLSKELENITEQLFSISPLPSRHIENNSSSPLTGCFDINGQILRGNIAFLSEGEKEIINFKFPAVQEKNPHAYECWSAAEFVHIDSMMRPHILTRVKDEQGTCEYTRFRAEANAVIIKRRCLSR